MIRSIMKYLLLLLLLSSSAFAEIKPENVLARNCLDYYNNKYLNKKQHQAFVYAREAKTDKDRCNWANGYKTAQEAIDSAMKGCRSKVLNAECKLVSSDGVFKAKKGDFTFLEPLDDSILSDKQKTELKEEAKNIILGNCLPFFVKFLEAKGHKSFGYSIDANGDYACGYSYKNQTKNASKRKAIKSCNDNKRKRGKKTPKSDCKVYAYNKNILLKANDFGIKLSPKSDKYLNSEEYKTYLTQAKAMIDDGACLMQYKYYLRGSQHQAYFFAKSKDGKQACGRAEENFTLDIAKQKAKKNCEEMLKKKKIKAGCKPFAENFKVVAKAGDFGQKEGVEDFKQAIEKRNMAKIKMYVDKGYDIHTQTDRDNITAIFAAAVKGDETLFFKLIDKGANIKHKGKQGSTLLLAAAGGDSPKIVRYLLNKGLDVNETGSHNMTPLGVSLGTLNPYIAAILMRAGADASIKDESGASAYDFAKKWKLDLDAMKNINYKEKDDDGFYPLFDAVKYGDEEMIEKLIKGGADVDKVSQYDMSPISLSDKENITRLLVKLGANINALDDEGKTPLMVEAEFGINIIPKVKLLLSLGADKSLKNNKGQTAYDLRMEQKNVSEELKALLK